MSTYIKKVFYILILLVFGIVPSLASEVKYLEAKNADSVVETTSEIHDSGIEIPNFLDVMNDKKKQQGAQKPPEQTEITLTSDEVFYNNDSNEVEATGHVEVRTKPEKSRITADRGIYSRANNTIKLFDNVVLYKDGAKLMGDYMTVDLSGENVLMNEPIGEFSSFKIKGKEGYAYANKIESINGEISLAKKVDVVVASYGFGSMYDYEMVQKELATDDMKKKRSDKFKINTKEIVINSYKDHDEVVFKDADLYYKKYKLANSSDIKIYTDKEQNYVEINGPEIGTLHDFGSYVGYGYVTKVPYGGTLKLTPALVLDNQLGFGGIVRHRSKRNFAEIGWASSSKNLIVRGRYKFNKNWWIDYGRHAHIDEWLYGYKRTGYLAQLVYRDAWHNDDLNLKYQHMLSGGYIADYSKNNQKNALNTARFRYQGQISKTFYKIGDIEQDMWLTFNAFARAAATVYGTGDTQAFFGVGPSIKSRVNGWGSEIAFQVNGIGGKSPLRADQYTYGHAHINIEENIRLHRYLTFGYRGVISPLKDNSENKLITENRFFVMVGPDDVKFLIAYDTIRSIASLDVIMLLGSDKLKTKYDKLTINNAKTLGKTRDKFEDLKFYKLKVPQEEL